MTIPEIVTPAGLRERANAVRYNSTLNDSGSCARHLELAAERIEVLERELEQAAIRFETMHKTCANLTGMALIGGENCRTPLAQ